MAKRKAPPWSAERRARHEAKKGQSMPLDAIPARRPKAPSRKQRDPELVVLFLRVLERLLQ